MLRAFARIATLAVVTTVMMSASVRAGPPPAVAVHASDANDCGVIQVTWEPLALGTTGANIYRDGVLISVVGPTVTRYLDYEMTGHADLTYCIEPFDAIGPTPFLVCDVAFLSQLKVSIEPWDWYNDVFPSSAAIPPGTPDFDKATAVLATGHNLAPCVGSATRAVMPDDKITITAPPPFETSVSRVDMIFRIEPGPGNYCVTGAKGSGLDIVPGGACAAAVPADGSFWGSLMADPGIYATFGAAAMHAAAPSGWDKNVWNSRQCEAVGVGVFQTTSFAAPGVDILPDGLFCPGTHVEYFFQIQFTAFPAVRIPLPGCVIQKEGEGSTDGHQWAEFTVLPDRWKDGAWPVADRHAAAPACVLVVDLDDGGGSERAWTSVADSIGATLVARYGANNGWHAISSLVGGSANPVDVDDSANNRLPDGSIGFINAHGGAPGTTWDLYNVKGARYHCDGNAGSLGGRAGVVPGGFTPPGPTPTMLRTYYRTIILLSGDRSTQILGPLVDRSQNDVGFLQDFLATPGGTLQPRALLVQGSGFAESETATPSHAAFLANYMGTTLVSGNYRLYSGNTDPGITLGALGPMPPKAYGVVNAAPVANDVLTVAGGSGAAAIAKYPDTATSPNPKLASIYHPPVFGQNWATVLNGWNIEDLGSFNRTTSYGRLNYHLDLFNTIFNSICPISTSAGPLAVGENGGPGDRVDLLRAHGNPTRGGDARFVLDLVEAADIRVGVYDLAGRLVRPLHEGRLDAGPHEFVWNGTDESGLPARSGVYLVRARNLDRGTLVSTKLTLLK